MLEGDGPRLRGPLPASLSVQGKGSWVWVGLGRPWAGETGGGHGLAAQSGGCLYMFKGPVCSVHQLISEVRVRSSSSISSISAGRRNTVQQIETSTNVGIFTRNETKRQRPALMAKE